MMNARNLFDKAAFVACVLVSANLGAAPWLDSIFRDGMVFSARQRTAITGLAEPGKEVTVRVFNSESKGMADADGFFSVALPALGVRKKPFEIVVTDAKGSTTLRDCLSGIVLLAAGQSNMEVPVEEGLNPEQEIAAATYPLIREFRVERDFDFVPQRLCSGRWTAVSPETAAKVGAVGLYTARLLQKELDGIPVGIVNNSYGGSPIQTWLPEGIVEAKYPRYMNGYKLFAPIGRGGVIRYREEAAKSVMVEDTKNEGEPKGWHRGPQPDWQELTIPGWIDMQVFGEDSDGAFWIARTFTPPEDMLDKDVEFRVTAIDDYDITYVNGVRIGATGAETPKSYEQPRAYRIRKGLLRKGENTISIRVFDTAHAGGVPPGLHSKICIADGDREFSLAGQWKTQAERIITAKAWPCHYLASVVVHRMACVLYNAMFVPVKNLAVDAILWYQGESNAGSGDYIEMLTDLIMCWRAGYGKGDIPFVVVQLAAFEGRPRSAEDVGTWPITRRHQEEVCRRLPNVRLVPAIDIGDEFRIHPLNKQEVGRRAALVLLQDFFAPARFKGVVAYPRAVRAVRVGDEIVVSLSDAQGLKTTDGRVPQSFAVVGEEDQKTKKAPAAWATARVVGETLRVAIPAALPDPKRVRYAWCMNPDVNTVNGLGFPLLPFDLEVWPQAGL